MGDVVDFPKKDRTPTAKEQCWGPEYYCLRCDGNEFKLYQHGTVHCAGCGSLMRNLLVSGTPEQGQKA